MVVGSAVTMMERVEATIFPQSGSNPLLALIHSYQTRKVFIFVLPPSSDFSPPGSVHTQLCLSLTVPNSVAKSVSATVTIIPLILADLA